MRPAARHAWIVEYLKSHALNPTLPADVNVLDRYFVDAYIAECEPKIVHWMPYGADKVPQLGRDLSAMFADGVLIRYTSGITGLSAQGFPRWCWSYQLKQTA